MSSRLRRLASAILAAVPGYSRFRFHQIGAAEYWERRYRSGGNSGDGSYGRLADFKAQILNEFVEQHRIASVVEFGCGDGHQLSLSRYPSYLGLDVSPTAVQRCAQRFADDPSKSFFLYRPDVWFDRARWIVADAALSLDVLYHLTEDESYRQHLRHLFGAARRFVVIYSADVDDPSPDPHVRPRYFTPDVARWFPEFRLIGVVDPPWKTDFRHYASDKTAAAFYFFERTGGQG